MALGELRELEEEMHILAHEHTGKTETRINDLFKST